jgi:hypothetical protein
MNLELHPSFLEKAIASPRKIGDAITLLLPGNTNIPETR